MYFTQTKEVEADFLVPPLLYAYLKR